MALIVPGFENGKKGMSDSPIEDEEADRGDLIINSNTRPRGRLEYRNRLKKKSEFSPIDLNLFNRLRPN